MSHELPIDTMPKPEPIADYACETGEILYGTPSSGVSTGATFPTAVSSAMIPIPERMSSAIRAERLAVSPYRRMARSSSSWIKGPSRSGAKIGPFRSSRK
jgi:hypothetical protein